MSTDPREADQSDHKCPECGATKSSAAGLAGHRLHAHGVKGMSRASQYRHRKQQPA